MEAMKRCPFCAEEILEAAIKCKHCGSMLGRPEGVPRPQEPAPPAPAAHVPPTRAAHAYAPAAHAYAPAAQLAAAVPFAQPAVQAIRNCPSCDWRVPVGATECPACKTIFVPDQAGPPLNMDAPSASAPAGLYVTGGVFALIFACAMLFLGLAQLVTDNVLTGIWNLAILGVVIAFAVRCFQRRRQGAVAAAGLLGLNAAWFGVQAAVAAPFLAVFAVLALLGAVFCALAVINTPKS